VAADLQRPAAIDQLHILGEQLGIPVYSDRTQKDPVVVCNAAVREAKKLGANVVILDTAGRLHVDDELMRQLERIDRQCNPQQVYLVVDGMTGQDAVNSAQAFNEALELNGVIMTKLDGDARGGALLSVKHVTGVPIKFIGTGEHLDSLELFRPEGMASRILGQGDMLQLVTEAQKVVDAKEQAELERKMREGEIGFDDFKKQLLAFSQPGLIQRMMSLMPGMGEMTKMLQNEDTSGGVRQMIGIIDSMTPQERRNPKLIDPSRRNRIARGAGVQATEVNQLVKQFESMKPVMQAMSGKGIGDRMKMVNELKNSGMLNPGAQGPKLKKDTGKRLSNKERQRLRKERERQMRKRKRDHRKGDPEIET
jgi:signal recognition particle subunit SRP54